VSVISPVSPPASSNLPAVHPDEIEAMLQNAITAYESQNYQEAVNLFNDLLTLDPENYLAYNGRGSAYTDLQDYEQALADYTRTIELGPLFPHSFYNRGRVYSLLGRYDEALPDLEKAIELAPPQFSYRAYGNIGLIYHKQGRYDEALEAFNQSIAHNQENRADVYFFRGETYTALQNYEAALSDFQAAIDRFSKYDRAYQSLGYAYFKMNQPEEARQALQKALDLTPTGAPAHLYLTLLEAAAGNFDAAKAAASNAVSALGNLPADEQSALLTRVLADLDALAQANPAQADGINAVVNLLPQP
jgi:tetratricopeptide (TPR) repeat protein